MNMSHINNNSENIEQDRERQGSIGVNAVGNRGY